MRVRMWQVYFWSVASHHHFSPRCPLIMEPWRIWSLGRGGFFLSLCSGCCLFSVSHRCNVTKRGHDQWRMCRNQTSRLTADGPSCPASRPLRVMQRSETESRVWRSDDAAEEGGKRRRARCCDIFYSRCWLTDCSFNVHVLSETVAKAWYIIREEWGE